MRKLWIVFSPIVLVVMLLSCVHAFAQKKTYQCKGEVINTFSILSRITIKHETIKGYAPAGITVFSTSSPDLTRTLSKGDLVNFVVAEEGDRSLIEKIEKIGVASSPETSWPAGRTAQEIIEATGQAAKSIAAPVRPASEAIQNTVDATTSVSGSVLNNINPDHKDKF